MADHTHDGAATAPGQQRRYACSSCGAAVAFDPGTTTLACPYCGSRTDIAVTAGTKNGFAAYVATAPPPVSGLPAVSVRCDRCGSTEETTALSGRCPSCAGAVVVGDDLGGRLKAPDGVVAFAVTRERATAEFAQWAGSRWFAPNALKKVVRTDSMSGCYLPHWGFDDRTSTDYTGRRGEHYWVTETYTVTVDGRQETRTRQVQKTHWYPASGRVSRAFVDVVAPAVTSPDRHLLDQLGPWETSSATAYDPALLAGFDTPRYSVTAQDGFADARRQMARQIEHDCRADIGGDEQQVSTMDTTDADVLFRLLLMPLWMATYLVGGRTYHVYVNANTGEVVGERPWSAVKISLAVLAAVAALAAVLVAYRLTH